MKRNRQLRMLRHQARLSQQDVADALGYRSFTTVQKWEDGSATPPLKTLVRLAQLYHVSFDQLMDEGQPAPVLGVVAGGPPIYAQQEAISAVQQLAAQKGFWLRVQGDSMSGDRICSGDEIYVRPQNEINDGEIAVVQVGDEATVKHVYRTSDCLILRSSNPDYPDQVYTDQEVQERPVRILGKVMYNRIRYGGS